MVNNGIIFIPKKYEYIKLYLDQFNYTLLDINDEADLTNGPLITICCPNGHITTIHYRVFKKRKENGRATINKCRECYKENKLNIAKTRADQLGYTLLTDEYIEKNMKLDIICDKGHECHPTYENFTRNEATCLTCTNELFSVRQRKPIEEVRSIIENAGYKMMDDNYINNQTPIHLQCLNGHDYYVTLGNFMKGKRCSKCQMSGGEQEISRILEKYQIRYIYQYRNPNCKNIQPLPFDFYLPDFNIYIEYDGKQHYDSKVFNRTIEEYLHSKYNDSIKTNFCYYNNLKLIRIPYWEFNNIEMILLNELNLSGITFNDYPFGVEIHNRSTAQVYNGVGENPLNGSGNPLIYI